MSPSNCLQIRSGGNIPHSASVPPFTTMHYRAWQSPTIALRRPVHLARTPIALQCRVPVEDATFTDATYAVIRRFLLLRRTHSLGANGATQECSAMPKRKGYSCSPNAGPQIAVAPRHPLCEALRCAMTSPEARYGSSLNARGISARIPSAGSPPVAPPRMRRSHSISATSNEAYHSWNCGCWNHTVPAPLVARMSVCVNAEVNLDHPVP